jgi:hypothetical protein
MTNEQVDKLCTALIEGAGIIGEQIGAAIDRNFSSPNVSDSNGEAAGLVDVLNYLANSAAMYLRYIEHEHPGSTKRPT